VRATNSKGGWRDSLRLRGESTNTPKERIFPLAQGKKSMSEEKDSITLITATLDENASALGGVQGRHSGNTSH